MYILVHIIYKSYKGMLTDKITSNIGVKQG